MSDLSFPLNRIERIGLLLAARPRSWCVVSLGADCPTLSHGVEWREAPAENATQYATRGRALEAAYEARAAGVIDAMPMEWSRLLRDTLALLVRAGPPARLPASLRPADVALGDSRSGVRPLVQQSAVSTHAAW